VNFGVQHGFFGPGMLQDAYHEPELDFFLHVIKLVNVQVEVHIFFAGQRGDEGIEPGGQLAQPPSRGKGPVAMNVVYVY
jgi:hypothetical protein